MGNESTRIDPWMTRAYNPFQQVTNSTHWSITERPIAYCELTIVAYLYNVFYYHFLLYASAHNGRQKYSGCPFVRPLSIRWDYFTWHDISFGST